MTSQFDITSPTGLSHAIDRLIAGDLNPSDRRSLLLRLDAIPDGWRLCALSFLEDQAWRNALVPSADVRNETSLPMVMRRSGRSKTHSQVLRYVIAASLVVAFCVSLLRVQRTVLPQHDFDPGVRRAAQIPVLGQSASTTRSQTSTVPDSNRRDEVEPGQPLGYLTLSNPRDGELPPQEVAILAATAENEQWLQAQPLSIPEYVKAQWERRGFLVEENRRLVGLDLQDGRRVGLPIDELAVDYVERQPL